jgi:hypothetical protein
MIIRNVASRPLTLAIRHSASSPVIRARRTPIISLSPAGSSRVLAGVRAQNKPIMGVLAVAAAQRAAGNYSDRRFEIFETMGFALLRPDLAYDRRDGAAVIPPTMKARAWWAEVSSGVSPSDS